MTKEAPNNGARPAQVSSGSRETNLSWADRLKLTCEGGAPLMGVPPPGMAMRSASSAAVCFFSMILLFLLVLTSGLPHYNRHAPHAVRACRPSSYIFQKLLPFSWRDESCYTGNFDTII